MANESNGDSELGALYLLRQMTDSTGSYQPPQSRERPMQRPQPNAVPADRLSANAEYNGGTQDGTGGSSDTIKSNTGKKSTLIRDLVIGSAAGLIIAYGVGMYKDRHADSAAIEAFRAASREATSAIGLGNAVYEVTAEKGACLHRADEVRSQINPVQCLPTGTRVRGIVAVPTHSDVAEARQWLLVSLTATEVRTRQKSTANEFPQGYLIPYGAVRPVTGAAASGAAPK